MNRMLIGSVALSALAALIVACGSGSGSNDIAPAGTVAPLNVSSGTVIQDVTVVNTADGALTPGQAVVVDGGTITKIAPNSLINVTGSATAVNGTGKYVVPGYLDMHTHLLSTATASATWAPMLLAHGVTGVREMSGTAGTPPTSLVPAVTDWNKQVIAGTRVGPEIVQIASTVLTAGVLNPGVTPDAAAAITLVQVQKATGASFLKVVSAATKPIGLNVLAAAKAQSFDVAGHLLVALTIPEHLAAGWSAIEHLGGGNGILLDCADDEAIVRAALLGGKGAPPPAPADAGIFVVNPNAWRLLDAPFVKQVNDTYNETKCQGIAKQMVAAGVWQIPTLIRILTMANSDAAAFRTDPNLKYIDPTIRALWEMLAVRFATDVRAVSADAALAIEQFYPRQRSLIRVLKQHGAKILAGSDLGGIWVLPGLGLHAEFAELSAGGLTPLEILQATTLNGAKFLKREATMGSVAEGKNADLVMLDANPIAAVANLSKIAAVFSKGKYYSKADLDKLKADVAALNAVAKVGPLSTVVDNSHTH